MVCVNWVMEREPFDEVIVATPRAGRARLAAGWTWRRGSAAPSAFRSRTWPAGQHAPATA
jgi:hypothetical protein